MKGTSSMETKTESTINVKYRVAMKRSYYSIDLQLFFQKYYKKVRSKTVKIEIYLKETINLMRLVIQQTS